MLGKLFVYDMKNQLRLWKYVYFGLILFSIFHTVLRLLDFRKGILGQIWGGVGILTKGFVIAAGIVMLIIAFLYPVLYFRKNLLKDQGYLMHTIPAKESELFFSKFLSGWCFVLLSALVFLAGLVIMRIGMEHPFSIPFIDMERGVTVETTLAGSFFSEECKIYRIILLFFFFAIPVNLMYFLFSLVMGYTMKQKKKKMNRDVLSVLVYLGIYACQQFLGIISLVFSVLICLGGSGIKEFFEKMYLDKGDLQFSMEYFMTTLVVVNLVILLGMAAAMAGISIRRLDRHLDLE